MATPHSPIIRADREAPKAHRFLPPAFIDAVQSFGADFQEYGSTVLAVRSLNTYPRFQDPAATKPGNLRAKSSDQPCCETAFPVDERFDRVVNGVRRLRTRDDYPRDEQGHIDLSIVPGKMSLTQVMEGIKEGTFKLKNSPEEIKKTGILEVEPGPRASIPSADPNYQKPTFRFDLRGGEPPPQIDISAVRSESEEITPIESASPQPGWWDTAQFGDWSIKRNYRHEVEYQFPGEEPKKLEVFGLPAINAKGEHHVLPLTSDIDGAYLAIPAGLEEALKNDPELKKTLIPINTKEKGHESDNTAKLIVELLKLNEFMRKQGKPTLTVNEINENATKWGNVTAVEGYFMININKRFTEKVPHVRDPFQHGMEINYDGPPSDISKLDHIGYHDGKKLLHSTTSIEETAGYIAHEKILEKSKIKVPDKEMWRPLKLLSETASHESKQFEEKKDEPSRGAKLG